MGADLSKVTRKEESAEDANIVPTMEYVHQRMNDPQFKKYELYTEVIVWALLAMKANPTPTVSEAFEAGCSEWDV